MFEKVLTKPVSEGIVGWIAFIVLGIWLVATPGGQTHAHLQSSVPAQDVVVDNQPQEVVLTYSEPVEVHFSTFKVYVIEPEEDLLKTKAVASQLVSEVLRKRNDQNDKARVDRTLSPGRGISDVITMGLKDGLEAGTYVVMWRVLSIDTHTTEGFYIFTYEPE